jgi:hypothetical protein
MLRKNGKLAEANVRERESDEDDRELKREENVQKET